MRRTVESGRTRGVRVDKEIESLKRPEEDPKERVQCRIFGRVPTLDPDSIPNRINKGQRVPIDRKQRIMSYRNLDNKVLYIKQNQQNLPHPPYF